MATGHGPPQEAAQPGGPAGARPGAGGEVAGRALLAVLGQVRATGSDPGALLHGMPFGLDDLRRTGFRVDWADFSTVWNRIDDRVGGAEAMERMALDIVGGSFVLRILGRVFLTPRQLYLAFVPRMGRAIYSNLRSSMVGLDDDRVVWESQLAPGYAFPRSFDAATRGLLRAYPRLLDLPEARVEGTSTDAWMRFVITLPPPRPLAAAWSRLSGPVDPAPGDASGHFDVARPEEIADFLGSRGNPPERVFGLGAQLPEATSVPDLAARVFALLESHFVVRTAALWAMTPSGAHSLEAATPGPPSATLHSRDLTVGGRHVGRLDVDGSVIHPRAAIYDEFEALLPWIAMALARLQAPGVDPEAAVAEIARAAGLTAREAQVLRWIREGKSDRDVAGILGISHRTVQKHVERILAKLGVESRLAAVRRTFEQA